VLQAEQEARIRAQRAAASAQDTHDQIRLELENVQREISLISSPGKTSSRAAAGDDDIPMVTINLDEEMLPAASQPESTNNVQKRETAAGDRYRHVNLTGDYHRNTTEQVPGPSNSSTIWIADAVEDADAAALTGGSRRSTSSIANVASSTSQSLRDPRSSPSPEQVDRLVPVVRTVLRADGVKAVRASHPRNIHDIL
jgi:hypothetical protein